MRSLFCIKKGISLKPAGIVVVISVLAVIFYLSKSQTQQTIEHEERVMSQQDNGPQRVMIATSEGDILIEMNANQTPVTVENFLRYVNEGFFDGTIFHRVIPNFMIQGGGFTPDMIQKQTYPPIINEAKNGLKNNRGTIAMARTPQPDSATSQFFINHRDNHNLNFIENRNPGYAVFGKVIEGMDVVDEIASVKTEKKGQYSDVPIEPVIINSAKTLPNN